jgi:hypothetical protein
MVRRAIHSVPPPLAAPLRVQATANVSVATARLIANATVPQPSSLPVLRAISLARLPMDWYAMARLVIQLQERASVRKSERPTTAPRVLLQYLVSAVVATTEHASPLFLDLQPPSAIAPPLLVA